MSIFKTVKDVVRIDEVESISVYCSDDKLIIDKWNNNNLSNSLSIPIKDIPLIVKKIRKSLAEIGIKV